MDSILYIEDNPGEAEIVSRLYQSVRKKFHEETEFRIAPTWQKGEEQVMLNRPSVVIADLNFPPEQTAQMTIEKIRMLAPTWPPILVLTGNNYDLKLRRDCILAGASDFMIKPDARHGCMELLCERVYHCFLRREYESRA